MANLESISAYKTKVATLAPDNRTGEISAADIRELLGDGADTFDAVLVAKAVNQAVASATQARTAALASYVQKSDADTAYQPKNAALDKLAGNEPNITAVAALLPQIRDELAEPDSPVDLANAIFTNSSAIPAAQLPVTETFAVQGWPATARRSVSRSNIALPAGTPASASLAIDVSIRVNSIEPSSPPASLWIQAYQSGAEVFSAGPLSAQPGDRHQLHIDGFSGANGAVQIVYTMQNNFLHDPAVTQTTELDVIGAKWISKGALYDPIVELVSSLIAQTSHDGDLRSLVDSVTATAAENKTDIAAIEEKTDHITLTQFRDAVRDRTYYYSVENGGRTGQSKLVEYINTDPALSPNIEFYVLFDVVPFVEGDRVFVVEIHEKPSADSEILDTVEMRFSRDAIGSDGEGAIFRLEKKAEWNAKWFQIHVYRTGEKTNYDIDIEDLNARVDANHDALATLAGELDNAAIQFVEGGSVLDTSATVYEYSPLNKRLRDQNATTSTSFSDRYMDAKDRLTAQQISDIGAISDKMVYRVSGNDGVKIRANVGTDLYDFVRRQDGRLQFQRLVPGNAQETGVVNRLLNTHSGAKLITFPFGNVETNSYMADEITFVTAGASVIPRSDTLNPSPTLTVDGNIVLNGFRYDFLITHRWGSDATTWQIQYQDRRGRTQRLPFTFTIRYLNFDSDANRTVHITNEFDDTHQSISFEGASVQGGHIEFRARWNQTIVTRQAQSEHFEWQDLPGADAASPLVIGLDGYSGNGTYRLITPSGEQFNDVGIVTGWRASSALSVDLSTLGTRQFVVNPHTPLTGSVVSALQAVAEDEYLGMYRARINPSAKLTMPGGLAFTQTDGTVVDAGPGDLQDNTVLSVSNNQIIITQDQVEASSAVHVVHTYNGRMDSDTIPLGVDFGAGGVTYNHSQAPDATGIHYNRYTPGVSTQASIFTVGTGMTINHAILIPKPRA